MQLDYSGSNHASVLPHLQRPDSGESVMLEVVVGVVVSLLYHAAGRVHVDQRELPYGYV
jgi:hypothetical protein